MIAPQEKELRAIIVLQNDPNFITIIEWVKTSIFQNSIELASIMPGDPLRMAQGRVQELLAFKKVFTDASALLDNMRAKKQAEQQMAAAKQNSN